MSTLSYKRFSNPAVLKRIDFKLFLKFLIPYKDYLLGKGLVWTEDVEKFDFSRLAGIFMKPSVDTPEELLDALYFIDDLSSGESQERLEQELEEAGIKFEDAEVSPEDMVLLAWLHDRNIVERVHAEKFLTRPKTFLSYFGRNPRELCEPGSEILRVLETDLDKWFEFKKRGRGAKVFPFYKDDGFWFLVRHGQRIKREGTVEPGGDSGSIFYRPEKFDVLIYYSQTGELTIYADTKGERRIYCELFGRHFFNSNKFFRFDKPVAKYTLLPLIEDGSASLVCTDILGITKIRLYELYIDHDSSQKNIEVRKAYDVMAALEEEDRDLRDEADCINLTCAKFKVTFSDRKERSVTLSLPNKASFDRESDNGVIHEWLTRRGFIISHDEDDMEINEDEAVLEMA